MWMPMISEKNQLSDKIRFVKRAKLITCLVKNRKETKTEMWLVIHSQFYQFLQLWPGHLAFATHFSHLQTKSNGLNNLTSCYKLWFCFYQVLEVSEREEEII